MPNLDEIWRSLAKLQPQTVWGPMCTRIPTSIQVGIHKAQQAVHRPAQPGSNPQKEITKGYNDLQYKILGSAFRGDPDDPCTQGAAKTNSRCKSKVPAALALSPQKQTKKTQEKRL